MDVVVKGRCYINGRLAERCVGIVNGRIADISGDLDGDQVFDYGSKLILPSAVDSHVHMRDPGATHKEDFASGTLSALHGGVTCVLDMPNTNPPTTTVKALQEKAAVAESRSFADFGLFAGIVPGCDVRGLSAGAVGFKLYMAGTTGGLRVPSFDTVRTELDEVASSGKVLAIHAEDEALRKKGAEGSLSDHLRNRPNECEKSAIRKLTDIAIRNLKRHVCHVSARESLQIIGGARDLTSEVTPHHLLLDVDSKLGAFGKVNPPLRKREDRQALFNGLNNGALDIIASDHAPHTVDEKEEDFDFAPCGMPGVETMVPLMLQLVKDRHVTIQTFVGALSERPAEVFGLNKGRIDLERDADLMVVDLTKSTEIKADMLHSRCAWTPYEGTSGIFPRAVFLRGEIMMENGSLVGERAGRDVVGKRESGSDSET
ncbi:MAG: dihydroorotase [Methanobacteriota archaeon]|nr:MAG: dihydroorotase [Euryarchaeota archaeon]